MTGLLFLSSDDFNVSKGVKGNILCNEIPGLALILFYSTECVHCHNLIPMYKTLPGSVNGCQFGMINVSTNKKCVMLSKDTLCPIEYVPLIILYADGRPYMRYNGPPDSGEIKKFIMEVASKLRNKQKFTNENVKNIKNGSVKQIPEYSVGVPLCGQDNVCYLLFDKAYV